MLTPREWEVLGLLRDGLSNPEIAERLGISRDGAKYHVSEILTKLGLASRSEAAAWRPAAQRPWWAAALAPIAGLWRRAPGALPAAAMAGGLAVIVGALGGLALLAFLLLDAGGGGERVESEPVTAALLEMPARPEDNVLYVIDEAGGEPLVLATSGSLFNVQWSPDGEQLAFIFEKGGDLGLATINTSGREPTVLRGIDDPTSSLDYLWSSSGPIALLVDGEGELLTAEGERTATFRASELVEWSPDGELLLIWGDGDVNPDRGEIAVLDAATGESRVVAETSTQWPQVAAWSPDGTQIAHVWMSEELTCGEAVSPYGAEALRVVDLPSGVSRDLLEPVCDAGFGGYDWSPDGQRLAFTVPGGAALGSPYERGSYVLDLASGDVRQIATGDFDIDLRWLPDGEHLAIDRASCVGCDGDRWWALVSEEGEQVAEWLGGFPDLGVAGDEARVAVGTVAGDLLLSGPDDPAGRTLFTSAPFQFRNVTWSPNGDRIAFVRWPGSRSHAYTAEPAADRVTPVLLAWPYSDVTFSPGLDRVAYRNRDGTLVVAPADDAADSVDIAHSVQGPIVWSPDSAWLAFLRVGDFPDGELLVASADGRQVREVLPDVNVGDAKIEFTWRPGTSQLLVAGESSGLAQPALIDVETGVRTPFDVASGDWSPDGSQIAYRDDRDVLVLDTATGETGTLLTLGPGAGAGAAWSPDGGTIAVLEVGADGILWLVDADGGEPRQVAAALPPSRTFPGEYLPDLRSYASRPTLRWSPDGGTLALNFLRDDGHGVFLYDLASEELTPVSLSGRSDRRHLIAGWSADGDALGIVSEWCFGTCP